MVINNNSCILRLELICTFDYSIIFEVATTTSFYQDFTNIQTLDPILPMLKSYFTSNKNQPVNYTRIYVNKYLFGLNIQLLFFTKALSKLKPSTIATKNHRNLEKIAFLWHATCHMLKDSHVRKNLPRPPNDVKF